MKKNTHPLRKITQLSLIQWFVFSSFCVLLISSCHDKDKSNPGPSASTSSVGTGYQQVTLVADTVGYGAARIDTNLNNAWGIAVGPTGNLWISSNHSGLTVVYDRSGTQQLSPVAMPSGGKHFGGEPTGVVYNSTSDFMIAATGEVSKFIFAGEDGKLYAWASGDSTRTVADRSSSDAVYKGLAIASDGGANFLYVANFKGGKVDVFDHSFTYVSSKPFSDPTIPAGFAPFNIKNMNGKLYVSYAKQKAPDNEDDEEGAGNGYINVFHSDGTLAKRFATQGSLNSPWGMTMAPGSFGQFSNALLVGNFGDGFIRAYDTTGTYMGTLQDNSTNIKIDGLWDILFPQNNLPAGDQNQLFFTSGPEDEDHGTFGYIKAR